MARELDINASFGALGPGWQANAAMGRALRLIMHNIGGGWPGAVSLAGLGQPGRYTLCLAEHEAESPWPPLQQELGYASDISTVTVMRAETAINVTGGLAEVASVMSSAVSYFTVMYSGKVAVALAPYVAQQLGREGWRKADVRQYLFEHSRIERAQLERSWLFSSAYTRTQWPGWLQRLDADWIPVVAEPDDITVIVAGGGGCPFRNTSIFRRGVFRPVASPA